MESAQHKPARFRPFPPVSCKFGAPMGRAGAQLDSDLSPDRLCVAGPAGEYDVGGAYWGIADRASGPVWAVWERGKGREGVAYVRARSREGAKFRALHGDELQCEIQPNGRARCTIGRPSDYPYAAGYGNSIIEAMRAAHTAFIAALSLD